MPIEINELECKRFGIVAARVTDPLAPLGAVDAEASRYRVDMISTRVDVANLERVHALEGSGYRLMDTLVYYGRSLNGFPENAKDRTKVSLRIASPEDSSSVAALAHAAFRNYMGHYHADPRLDSTAADAAYVEWAETSTSHTTVDTPVFVVEDDKGLAGFLTMRRNDDAEFEIVLNAVHPDSQGKGYYTVLVLEALRFARSKGGARMIVSTQINNYAVQKVWALLGFNHYRSFYTFHKWLTPQSI
ncbi:N-acetyltransferase family protein [Hwanghaeella sp.]|uniref:GNAT family N-acetyltransferase n=1 Tax=Hwanghaeella sp. TaxID=2605943 RepID=UPI003CCBEBE6